jgi:hypothetical protein
MIVMSQNTQNVEVAQSNTTANYGVYDSPDGDEHQSIVGMYISDNIVDQIGEFVTVSLSLGGSPVEATLDRTTSGYAVLSTQADAIESMYVSHELLDDFVDDYDSDDGIDSIGVTLVSSTESAFEEALEEVTHEDDATEQEAEALIGSDESDENETVEIEDEAASLVE